MKKLSIIVPTHRRQKALSRLLESLSRQSLSTTQFEILVVSNFPDPQLKRAIFLFSEAMKNIRILSANAPGANASRNLGIQESKGELLLLLDDDCIANNPRYLDTVIDLHDRNPDALAIGGSYSIPEDSRLEDVAYNLISQEWQSLGRCAQQISLRLIGGNVSYKRSLLRSTSELFNPRITYGGAELEFHHRLANKGARLLLFQNMTVLHAPEINKAELVKKAFKQAITTVKFSIDDPSKKTASDAYQAKRVLLALKYARNPGDFENLCALMRQYDRAYNLIIEERIDTLARLRLRLWGWKAKTRNRPLSAKAWR